jgi:hypothetical protein
MDYKALHSPSCCLYKGELYVTFYAGERECVNQRVFIFKKQKSKFVLIKKLPFGTGNPALMVMNGNLFCVHSVFTKPMVNNVFDLWQTTYTAVTNVETDSQYVLSTYCCPRNNPYVLENGGVILPCYDENIERGMVFYIKNNIVDRAVCMFDYPVIQPSAFRLDNKLYLLFRNFNRKIRNNPEERVTMSCQFGFSPAQNKIVFSGLAKTKIPNHNESVATINDPNGFPLVVYNGVQGRKELSLGFLQKDSDGVFEADKILELNEETKGSYPNMCYNKIGQLIVSFTSYENGINSGSRICIAKISKDYSKVLSRSYIDGPMLGDS